MLAEDYRILQGVSYNRVIPIASKSKFQMTYELKSMLIKAN